MSRHYSLSLLGCLLIGSMVACDKVPLTSPTGSTVTLTISTTSIPINGTAQVTAAVIESAGTSVHDGTMVTFVGALGNFSPPEAATVGGVARTIFTGTGSGTAKIGAFSGAAKATEIEVKVGGAAAEKVTVRTEPSSIPQTGGTVTVIAGVTDASGNALPNTPISFTVDQGSLSSSSSTTDANGDARVSLTTNRTTKVTANVAGKTAEFTVTALAAPTVGITTCTAAQTVGVLVNCTITPTVATGGSPIQNLTVNWGDGTGEQPIGGVSATSVSHTYTAPGNYTMVAAATDLNSQRGTAAIGFVVNRILPTITVTCPTAAQFTSVPIAFSVAPPATSAIPISNVTVDFGDGTSRNLGQITGPTGFTKAYTAPGGYSVTATVTDTSGQRGSSACAVIVNTSQPNVTLSHTSAPVLAGAIENFSVSASVVSGAPSISNITVTRSDTLATVYSGAGNGSFSLTVGVSGTTFTLDAVATDASGTRGTTSLVVTVP